MFIVLFFLKNIPQDPNYHNFCDQRIFLSIPNFMDVVSNIGFIIVGLYGLLWLRKSFYVKTFSVFILLIGLGSGLYHIQPNNISLVFDRLPMACAFMSLLGVIIHNYIKPLTIISFVFLIAIGILSVLYWIYTESLGVGDLRLYALIQFGTLLAIIVIGFLYKINIFTPILLYVFAKISEYFDCHIYQMTQLYISGHTIKHLLSAIASFILIQIMHKRIISS